MNEILRQNSRENFNSLSLKKKKSVLNLINSNILDENMESYLKEYLKFEAFAKNAKKLSKENEILYNMFFIKEFIGTNRTHTKKLGNINDILSFIKPMGNLNKNIIEDFFKTN